jgi:hypothetical protein
VYVINGTFTMSGGAVSGNTASDGGGVSIQRGTFTMSGGMVSGNNASSESGYGGQGGGVVAEDSGTFVMNGGMVSGNTASYGGGVFVQRSGTFVMNGGMVSGNTASNGGGVFVDYHSGTFAMSGGTVSDNTDGAGAGVSVGGTFTMSGGAVRDNILSGNGYGKEVVVMAGTFKMFGDSRPERVFLRNSQFITIGGLLGSWTIPLDLEIYTVYSPLTEWVNKPILQLDVSYGSGNLANLKDRFSLGNSKFRGPPYTETAITGYRISDDGRFVIY